MRWLKKVSDRLDMEMNIIRKEKPYLIMFRIILIIFWKAIDMKLLRKPRNYGKSDGKWTEKVRSSGLWFCGVLKININFSRIFFQPRYGRIANSGLLRPVRGATIGHKFFMATLICWQHVFAFSCVCRCLPAYFACMSCRK